MNSPLLAALEQFEPPVLLAKDPETIEAIVEAAVQRLLHPPADAQRAIEGELITALWVFHGELHAAAKRHPKRFPECLLWLVTRATDIAFQVEEERELVLDEQLSMRMARRMGLLSREH